MSTLSPTRKALFDSIVERGHAMITTGEYLGVMVAPDEFRFNCPPGWVFIPTEQLSEEIFQAAMETCERGRKDWPKNAKIVVGKKKKDDTDEDAEIFGDGDYL